MIKTHTIDAAVMDNGKAVIKPRTERYIQIPMPWTKQMYDPTTDDVGKRRPVLAIYWHNPAKGSQWALVIRIGWTCRMTGYVYAFNGSI